MRFIDFFGGVGMMRIGLEQAGHDCVGYVEWNKYARRTYAAIHDTEGEFNGIDIKDVHGTDLPKSDIWAAGFPCTDISIAGRQRGLAGEQSGLFTEVIRLLGEVEESEKPSYLLFENVDNTLSVNKGWDFARILVDMDERGYDAQWKVVSSTELGIPQRRHRIFIVGYLRGSGVRRVFI
ncbi:TPA: DNA (cytosine-5-)-methyltransferase [Bacillus cereus]|nr:DNA (cytosine-5-)-methyltransferase [Bacillus thuringiensis]PGV74061.1 DNA (cytosine-5-)-methyltransferase [Bacillus thuringiensis]HDR4683587.1 DNA (cytosine-5-)-methyltransferase [Bacillus cereus]HDR4687040.1 DNA (cytosine-5-)-methyltransferase [Bacillus cereus]